VTTLLCLDGWVAQALYVRIVSMLQTSGPRHCGEYGDVFSLVGTIAETRKTLSLPNQVTSWSWAQARPAVSPALIKRMVQHHFPRPSPLPSPPARPLPQALPLPPDTGITSKADLSADTVTTSRPSQSCPTFAGPPVKKLVVGPSSAATSGQDEKHYDNMNQASRATGIAPFKNTLPGQTTAAHGPPLAQAWAEILEAPVKQFECDTENLRLRPPTTSRPYLWTTQQTSRSASRNAEGSSSSPGDRQLDNAINKALSSRGACGARTTP
jgi:hypothetical protein